VGAHGGTRPRSLAIAGFKREQCGSEGSVCQESMVDSWRRLYNGCFFHCVFSYPVMTHKYRRCIVVLSINKSVKPNEEQKVLKSSFDQGFTVNTGKRVFRGIW
jgi:hypothetical protein